MMNVARRKDTVFHRGWQYPARSKGFLLPVKKPMPTGGKPTVTQRIARPVPPYDRTSKDWTTIAWPTNDQSRTPDGRFGPAKMMAGLGDCWFMAVLVAVANDEQGRQILAGSIKQLTVQGIRGYAVTFQGAPNIPVFISDQMLDHCLEINGGDADTRLMELAADRFFSVIGNYRFLYIDAFMNMGMNRDQAEQCFQKHCQSYGNQDPMTINPMRQGGSVFVVFFMLTGTFPDFMMIHDKSADVTPDDVVRFLNQHLTNDRNSASVVITGIRNPLGNSLDAKHLVVLWDAIRTEITSNGTLDSQAVPFLNAVDKWLETGNTSNLQALRSASRNLVLQHVNPSDFTDLLVRNQFEMSKAHINLLRSGVQDVLVGESGCIGFPGEHSETIEEINPAEDTITYSDPNYPTLLHTGELTGLIQAINAEKIFLTALKPITGQDEAESSHAGETRGRHLLALHHRAVRDKTIDPAESRPLANLMDMDEETFRHVYDSDNNGTIEGGELKAVQRRVNRWVNHLTLTPIWS